MIGAFDTTSPLTQTDFYVAYIFSVWQLIGIFFLIRLSFVYRSSPIIQVQNLPARPQTTIKNRKDEQGGRSTFGRLNLKTDEKKRKKKTGWTELLETGRSAVMRMRVSDPCDTVSESDVWEPNAVIKFSHVKRTF